MKRIKIIAIFTIVFISSCFVEIEKPLPPCDLSVAVVNVNQNNDALSEVVADIIGINADVVMVSNFSKELEKFSASFESASYSVFFHTDEFHGKFFPILFLVKKNFTVIETVACEQNYVNGNPEQRARVGVLRLKVKEQIITLLTMNPLEYRQLVYQFLGNISDGLFTYEHTINPIKINGEQVIWGGSFGFLASSPLYREFRKSQLLDAHRAGVEHNRYNVTTNKSIRSDYIFFSKSIDCRFSGTFAVTNSNHRGVVAGFTF